MKQAPYCLAMVLCDGIYREPVTGKLTILGTFSRLRGPAVPIQAVFSVYFCVTDALGEMSIGLRIVDSKSLLTDDKKEAIAQVTLPPMTSEDPLMVN